MKVLFVTNCYPLRNRPTYGIFVKEQIEALASRYQDFSYDVYFINGLKGKFEYVKSVMAIRQKIKENSYDLVHIHYGLSGFFLLLGKIDIPVVITLHGGDILIAQGKKWQVMLTKQIIKRADEVIILNSEMYDAIKGCAKQIVFLPCSVNTSLFTQKVPRPFDYHKDVRILFPAFRNRTVKNFPLYQEVCNLLEQNYGYHVKQLYLENKERNEVADLYNSVDLMLMTSVSEGSPGVIKEAMACNVPIVSTNVGDVKSNLEGVANCYVSMTGTGMDLAEGVNRCLMNKVSGISGREKIVRFGLDDDTISDKLYNIYKSL